MSTRAFTEEQLCRYITALHEAAHAFVAHKSERWTIKDPAVTFPAPNSGHVARAHFGPKVMLPKMTKEYAREYIKIGYAGLAGQNLIGEDTLVMALGSRVAGCDDDLSMIEEQAKAAGIEDELDYLMNESFGLVLGNAETIYALAEAIYAATGDVPQANLLKVLGAGSNPGSVSPSPDALPDIPRVSKGASGWLKSFFGKK